MRKGWLSVLLLVAVVSTTDSWAKTSETTILIPAQAKIISKKCDDEPWSSISKLKPKLYQDKSYVLEKRCKTVTVNLSLGSNVIQNLEGKYDSERPDSKPNIVFKIVSAVHKASTYDLYKILPTYCAKAKFDLSPFSLIVI